MINERAARKFLKRPIDSYEWLKNESLADVDQALTSLRPKPDFGLIKPWLHQKIIFLILNELKRFMLHVDMGGGKTLISLMLLKYLKQAKQKPKAIVFVPYVTSVLT